MEDGQRAIAIAPTFPASLRSQPDQLLEVRVTFLGRRAIDLGKEVIQGMTSPRRMFELGKDRCPFILQPLPPSTPKPEGCFQLRPEDFCLSPEQAAGRIPWVRLELLTPLFLKETSGPGQTSTTVMQPSFTHLFRACLRTIGRAFATFGSEPLEGTVDFAGLKALSEQVPTEAAQWLPFRQAHITHRSDQRYHLRGIMGHAIFRDVPAGLLPWLIWGGRLGVGEHRVAGAGCWQLSLL